MPIDRAGAEALINQQNANEIFEGAEEQSAALRTFRTVRMASHTTRMPVIDVLPTAGFVGEGTGAAATKPSVNIAWANKDLVAEEIAAIAVIPENVFDDSEFNIWNEVRPRLTEAFGAVLDAAVFFGGGAGAAPAKPATWPASIEVGARNAGNVYSQATAGDLVEDVNQVWALVEADGFDVNVNYAARTFRARLRGLRDANQQPLLQVQGGLGQSPNYQLYGEDLEFVTNGAWRAAVADADAATAGDQPAGADLIAGDRTKAILGIRQDVTYKILTEATVGGVSLAENDLIGLRAKFRVAFQVADHTTVEGGATAYPFAVLGA